MNAAKKLMHTTPTLQTGTVTRLGAKLEVRVRGGSSRARRAKSCLVAPELGDTVLCAMDANGCWVLAVLEGPTSTTKLEAEGDLEVVAGRNLSLHAAQDAELVGGNAVAVGASELHVRADSATVSAPRLGFLGRIVHAELSRLSLVAEEVDQTIERLALKAKRVFRVVDELDQTRAGSVDLRAQELMAVRGENTVIAARVLAKVDGEQVHIG